MISTALAALAATVLGAPGISPRLFSASPGPEPGPRAAEEAPATRPPPTRQLSRLKLRLNLPAYRLELFRDDSLIRRYTVAIGETAYPTPVGSFTVTRVDWDPWWVPPASEWAQNDSVTPPGPGNPMGRVRLAFMELYFIHGTPYPHSVGSPASHGCVRLSNANAIDLAKRVIAMNAPQVSTALVNKLAATRGKTTHSIPLEVPVPLEIRYDITSVERGKLTVYPDVYHRLLPPALPDSVMTELRRALGDSLAVDSSRVRAGTDRTGSTGLTLDLPDLR